MINLLKYLSYLCFAGAVLLFLRNRVSEQNNQLSKAQSESQDNKVENRNTDGSLQATTPKTTIGYYYVNDSLVDGIIVYKDVYKKNNFSKKLPSMSELDIKKIENGMGYSELLYGQYANKGGWVKMNDVTYHKDMFPENDKGVYFVKSSAVKGIPIYKDKMRKKKYNTRIAQMKELDISKISGGMAYTKFFITSDFEMISGWVDINYLEKKEK